MSFSELLKQCRKKQGISQAELAARLGVTQQAVGKWRAANPLRPFHRGPDRRHPGHHRRLSAGAVPPRRRPGRDREPLFRRLCREPHPGDRHPSRRGMAPSPLRKITARSTPASKTRPTTFIWWSRGDSMEPRIQDGDLALVHRPGHSGKRGPGVIIYGDEGEGTLKRYIQRGNSVVLAALQPQLQRAGHQGRGPEPAAHRRPRGGDQDQMVTPGDSILY